MVVITNSNNLPSSSTSSPPAVVVPPSPYGTFQGSLFQYSRNLVAFESSSLLSSSSSSEEEECDGNNNGSGSKKKCILLGGLSDGLIPVPYTKLLEEACHDVGWDLVQPIISSSYLGFGYGTLERDTNEMNELMEYLIQHRQADTFAIVGHSTGCQNSIHFLKHGSPHLIHKTKVVALQAPVSDREGAMLEPNYNTNIQHARRLVDSGDGNEMMPRSAFWAPITAQRFQSLQDTINAEDDFFSSDLSDLQLLDKLSHVTTNTSTDFQLLAAFSKKDEYVPNHVDIDALSTRLCQAMNNNIDNNNKEVASKLILHNGNHNLSNDENDKEIFVQAVKEKLKHHT